MKHAYPRCSLPLERGLSSNMVCPCRVACPSSPRPEVHAFVTNTSSGIELGPDCRIPAPLEAVVHPVNSTTATKASRKCIGIWDSSGPKLPTGTKAQRTTDRLNSRDLGDTATADLGMRLTLLGGLISSNQPRMMMAIVTQRARGSN